MWRHRDTSIKLKIEKENLLTLLLISDANPWNVHTRESSEAECNVCGIIAFDRFVATNNEYKCLCVMSVYCCARFIPPIYLYIWLSLPLVHIDTQPDQATLSIWILICFTCPIVNSPYPFPTWFQLQFCCFGKLYDISCMCGAGPPLGHKLHICKIYGCIRKPVCQPIDQFRSDCEKWDSIFRFCFRFVVLFCCEWSVSICSTTACLQWLQFHFDIAQSDHKCCCAHQQPIEAWQ